MIVLARRLLHLVFLALGTSFLCFVFLDLAPGDYLTDFRGDPRISVGSIDAVRDRLGLQHSLFKRYGEWILSVAGGSWGTSFQYGCPVSRLLWERAGHTLLLTGSAMLITWPAAILAGVFLASSRSGWLSRAIAGLIPPALSSIPDLLLALFLLLFATQTGLFPAGGMASVSQGDLSGASRVLDVMHHLALPAICLALTAIPVVLLHVRSAMEEALGSRFLQAARAHGIGQCRLLFRHALPAASNTLISLFGLSLGSLLSSSLVVEAVMGWPGLGRLLLEAIQARDTSVVVGATVISALAAAGGTLVADLLLLASDPRIRRPVP